MSLCRFEDREAGRAIVLHDLHERITACAASEVDAALARIDAARRAGHWVALLLDYELGEWLEPGVLLPGGTPAGAAPPASLPSDGKPRLTALVYRRHTEETPWPAPDLYPPPQVASVRARVAPDTYRANVRRIAEWIAAGELYQVNYTMPLDVTVQGPAPELYAQLASRHPSAHAAYIEDAGRTVLSFSPELFLARQGSLLRTRPMKGTAPRHADPEQDAASARALQASEKNRAENLMIVDLLRNDLGRVARPGSVRVRGLFELERYASVWTLTSTIEAEAPGAGLGEILRALFPCGSVTGAPKIAAMRRIRELEPQPRGLYCGSIGWLAPDGDFSLNVAIRTLVLSTPDSGTYHAGGGIVADSDPALEWEECEWKSRVLTR
ncbi:aminodeoxychorismate synthase component I [Orrella sp. JC864]|uniref:aminodeoxychorismate synthase component I n=1 Tax=Orrella sp. JC864 TaxID=3120298 RepID=UPI00300ACCEA